MATWKQQLQKYNSLLEQIVQIKEKKEGELRFNRCTIRASDVAGQYYCEKKIETRVNNYLEKERELLIYWFLIQKKI